MPVRTSRSDAAKLLGLAASYDQRTVGDADVLAWGDALSDLEPEACAEAIKGHYRDFDTRITPAAIRLRCKAAKEVAAQVNHMQKMRQVFAAPFDAEAAHQGYLEASAALAYIRAKSDEDERRITEEQGAKRLQCTWEPCRARIGEPCETGGLPRKTSHPNRLDEYRARTATCTVCRSKPDQPCQDGGVPRVVAHEPRLAAALQEKGFDQQ